MPVTAIIGYGPGLGAAYARTFRQAGYDLALLSRSGATEAGARAYTADATDPEDLKGALENAANDLGPIDVLIYNADIAAFGDLDAVDEETFERNWRVASLGLYAAARSAGRAMAKRGSGTIIVSGASAALRGRDWTTAFAPAKAAQRILAQALAKQLGPKGVHVAYLVIDAVIDTKDTRAHFAHGKPDEFFADPDKIAETALFLARQDRSAWTFEADIRPFGETW